MRARRKPQERLEVRSYGKVTDTPEDRLADFLHFYDFYIVSAALVIVLLVIIFKGL